MRFFAVPLCLLALCVCSSGQIARPTAPTATNAATATSADSSRKPDGSPAKKDAGAKPDTLSTGVAPAAANPAARLIRTASGVITLPAEKSSPVHVPRFDKPPVIDGKLD